MLLRTYLIVINISRGYINQLNRRKRSEEIENNDLPMFVICNDDSSTRTVVLGAQISVKSITTIKIDILGYLSADDNLVSVNNIERNHILTLGQRGKGSKVRV